MKRLKRGKPRKSRRLRLRSSSFEGRSEFKLEPDLQRELEQALEVSLSLADASALTEIVTQYFSREPFEAAAPHVDDAMTYLQRLQDGADNFAVALGGTFKFADAAAEVQRLIMRQYPRQEGGGMPPWEYVLRLVYDFQGACTRARELLKAQKLEGFVEGEAWRQLIIDLTGFCKERSWPTGVAKASTYRSRFRKFVMTLQKAFPENLQRHVTSDEALATAINAARALPGREQKETGKSS
jgi:hypothetical protein